MVGRAGKVGSREPGAQSEPVGWWEGDISESLYGILPSLITMMLPKKLEIDDVQGLCTASNF